MKTTQRKWLAGIVVLGLLGLAGAACPRGAHADVASRRAHLPPHMLAHDAAPEAPAIDGAAPALPRSAPSLEAPRRPRLHASRAPSPPHPAASPTEVTPEGLAEDRTMTWDDLFPNVDREAHLSRDQAVTAPCYDRIQGVGGLSPCPAVTPR